MEYLQKDTHYKKTTLRKWDDLVEREKKHRNDPGIEQWIFRGHINEEYFLQTYFERAIADIGIKNKKTKQKYYENLEKLLQNGLNGQKVNKIEEGLIRRFKRQYYHFDLKAPGEEDVIEWLAIMRHYGAPTRLLDWTYSFYIAAFFALEEADGACALWALETKSLEKEVQKEGSVLSSDEKKLLNKFYYLENHEAWQVLFQNGRLFVYPVNPFRLNERLVLQQGAFLCPGDISKPFETNLRAVLPEDNKSVYKLYKYIIDFNVKERRDALLQLHRMNINRATLFPGLEGFAKSLKTLLVSPANLLYPREECKKSVYMGSPRSNVIM